MRPSCRSSKRTISTSCSAPTRGPWRGHSGDAVRLRVETRPRTRTIEGSDILVAAGQTPNTRDVGLEQAGIELDELRLQDLGVHKYLPRKDLHLFLLNPPDPALNIELCHCSTHYVPRYGTREVPEIDAYRWTRRAEVPDLCGKNMTRVLMALDW